MNALPSTTRPTHRTAAAAAAGSAPLLELTDVVKSFPGRSRGAAPVQAVASVSLSISPGETLGLVGESGCGKSTTLRCAVGLLEPTSGTVTFRGQDLSALPPAELRLTRRHFQTVFQDPQASLNPRMRVGDILTEPLAVHGVPAARRVARAKEAAALVQLPPDAFHRYPHQFSGGQRQRVGIARALVLNPALLALDEPVSALDVSIQAEILDLLERLRDDLGLAYLFVAHDLSVVRHISDRVAVMYLGRIVEIGSNADLYTGPAHPYSQALFSAAPVPDPRAQRARRRIALAGDVPDPSDPPSGCRFRTRCPKATVRCATEDPVLQEISPGQHVACHYPDKVDVLTGASTPPPAN